MAEGRRAAPRGSGDRSRSQSSRERYDYDRPERGQSSQSPSQRRPRRSSRLKRSAGARVAGAFLYVLLVIGLSAILATLGWVWACDLLGLNKEAVSVEITIDEDTQFSQVVDTLEEEGLIQYKFLFKLYAWFSHAEDKIAPGTYTLDTEMDYRALVANMGSSSTTRKTIDLTIPEGYTIDQLFELLDKRGVASVDKLRDMSANWDYAFDWLKSVPLGDYHRLEGYLMPATYDFYTPHDPVYALNKLLVYFDSQVNEDVRKLVDDSGYTLQQVLTIASMIERETTGEDREDISAVIRNRLNSTDGGTMGFLQIDATLVYINGGREPTEADKSIDSPYNTYLYKGLPPGPIANPGMESIVAALNPSDIRDFYYTLGDDNTHHFFRTYDQLQKFIASQERYNSN